MAARSFDPASRRDSPQSLRASAAGRRRPSMSAKTSIAADRRAAGGMAKPPPVSQAKQDANRKNRPHPDQHDPPSAVGEAAAKDNVRTGVNGRMDAPRHDKDPRQHDRRKVGLAREEG